MSDFTPIRLDVDTYGVPYIPFAKKELIKVKEIARIAGLFFLNKRINFNAETEIYVETAMGIDTIRITSKEAGGKFLFLGNGSYHLVFEIDKEYKLTSVDKVFDVSNSASSVYPSSAIFSCISEKKKHKNGDLIYVAPYSYDKWQNSITGYGKNNGLGYGISGTFMPVNGKDTIYWNNDAFIDNTSEILICFGKHNFTTNDQGVLTRWNEAVVRKLDSIQYFLRYYSGDYNGKWNVNNLPLANSAIAYLGNGKVLSKQSNGNEIYLYWDDLLLDSVTGEGNEINPVYDHDYNPANNDFVIGYGKWHIDGETTIENTVESHSVWDEEEQKYVIDYTGNVITTTRGTLTYNDWIQYRFNDNIYKENINNLNYSYLIIVTWRPLNHDEPVDTQNETEEVVYRTVIGNRIWGFSCFSTDNEFVYSYIVEQFQGCETWQDWDDSIYWLPIKKVFTFINKATGAKTTHEYTALDENSYPSFTAKQTSGLLEKNSKHIFKIASVNPFNQTNFSPEQEIQLEGNNTGIKLTWDLVTGATHYIVCDNNGNVLKITNKNTYTHSTGSTSMNANNESQYLVSAVGIVEE